MGSVNEVTLVGNLTRDPELRHTSNKKPVCILGLSTNRHWVDENGERHEEPEYHRLVAFDKLAETCNRYLRKGRKIYARGRLQYHTYTGQDSVKRTGVEIMLEKMEMLDSMPQDVKESLDQKDTSNGAPAQQV